MSGKLGSTRLCQKVDFELHERHAFGNHDQGNEAATKECAQVINGFMIDFVDAQRQAVRAFVRDELAFEGANFLDDVVEFFEKCRVVEMLGTDTR